MALWHGWSIPLALSEADYRHQVLIVDDAPVNLALFEALVMGAAVTWGAFLTIKTGAPPK